jgi:hypothetical protein
MIKSLAKYLISSVFILSAFTKLYDYHNTVSFFNELFSIGLVFSKNISITTMFWWKC